MKISLIKLEENPWIINKTIGVVNNYDLSRDRVRLVGQNSIKFVDSKEQCKIIAPHRPTDIIGKVDGIFAPFFDLESNSPMELMFFVMNKQAWLGMNEKCTLCETADFFIERSGFLKRKMGFIQSGEKRRYTFTTVKKYLPSFNPLYWFNDMDVLPVSHIANILKDPKLVGYFANKLNNGTFNLSEFTYFSRLAIYGE